VPPGFFVRLKKAILPYKTGWLMPTPYHTANLVPPVTRWISVMAIFGREKEACDMAPEASADRSDFSLAIPGLALPSWGGTSTS